VQGLARRGRPPCGEKKKKKKIPLEVTGCKRKKKRWKRPAEKKKGRKKKGRFTPSWAKEKKTACLLAKGV